METPRILIWDIETTPSLVWTWGYYQQNVLKVEQDWYFLSVAYRWYGDKGTEFLRKSKKRRDDKTLVKQVWSLLDEADYVVAHNGDRFDQKKANARFFYYGLGPPSPYVQIDTLKETKRHFNLISNKLNEIARFKDLGQKTKHGSSLDLWFDCMDEVPEAWALMEEYNRQDVELLAEVYEVLAPWIGHPGKAGPQANAQQWVGKWACTKLTCGSFNVVRRGYQRTKAAKYATYQCKDCGGYSRALLTEDGNFR